ncbi:MAG: DUF58 domain-containing protein [Actinomycetales bacterium]|nr:DUF58 domain-containing protein [Actinomycetales bacterium]
MTTDVDVRTRGTKVVAFRRRAEGALRKAGGWIATVTDRPRSFARPVTEVVTPTAWTLAAMIPFLAWGATSLGWIELRVGTIFLTALLLVSIAFVFGKHQLVARFDLSRDRVVVGERANGRIVLTNESAHRSLPMSVELPVGAASAGFDLPSLPAQAEHEDLFAIPTSRRAVLTVGPVRTVRADPLGLLRREQQLTDEHLLYVHPKTVRIQGTAAGFVRDLEGQVIRKITDSDVAFHALRAYVPGDDRRYVHWKSTARTGMLMVRQFEETRRSHLAVGLSTRLDDYASSDEFELAVSVAGSLGVQAILDGQEMTAATSSNRLRIAGATSLLDNLSGVDFELGAQRLPDLARRIAREAQGASVVIFVCGSVVDPAEFRRARRQLPPDVRTVVVRTQNSVASSLSSMGDIDISTIGELEDLPPTMRRLQAG